MINDDFAKIFYSRQTVLKELGEAGQKKLKDTRVAVVGVGGLGSVSSLYLTLAGVGYIRVIDQDTIETHNLHRQILYNPERLSYPKAEAAAEKLQKHNPTVTVEAASENLNSANAETLLKDIDIIVDGLDNIQTRYIVNRVCVSMHVPYVFGAAIGLEGNASVFYPPKTGCLECLMPRGSAGSSQTCDTRGIIGATAGTIGCIQALETIKLITGIGEPLIGKLLVCDFTAMDFTSVPIMDNPACPVCHRKTKLEKQEARLVWLCGKDTANINSPKRLNLNLDQVYLKLKQHFEIRLKSQLALVFSYRGFDISLFSGGRMLIKGVTEEKTALSIYHEILQKIA